MSFILQNTSMEQVVMLRSLLATLSSSERDLVIIPKDGGKIFTHKKVLCLFSSTASSWLSSVSSCANEMVAISVDASYKTITDMLTILTTGKSAVDKEEKLLDLVNVAEMFGIDMENSEIEFKKSFAAIKSSRSKKLKSKTEL